VADERETRRTGAPGTGSGDVARTELANERTYLAWWRTSLAAFAVALGIGRLAPDLLDHPRRWPYVAVGCGYAVLGVGLALYGLARYRAVNRAVASGEYLEAGGAAMVILAAAATVLGVLTFAIIVAQP
jgi:putative membrane protein